MHDEERDPDMEALRSYWTPPAPSDELDVRVLRAYRRINRRRRFRIPVAAAMLVLVISGLLVATRRQTHPATVGSGMEFVPVRQPRIVVLSQGERP